MLTMKKAAKRSYKRRVRGNGNRNVKVLKTVTNKLTGMRVELTSKTTIDGKKIYAVIATQAGGYRPYLETFTGYVAVLRAWDVFNKAVGRKAA